MNTNNALAILCCLKAENVFLPLCAGLDDLERRPPVPVLDVEELQVEAGHGAALRTVPHQPQQARQAGLVTLQLSEHSVIADTVVMFAALTGFHYNLTNIYSGMVEAKDKMYALGCILPYA